MILLNQNDIINEHKSSLLFLPLVTSVGNHEPSVEVYRDVYEAPQIQYRRFLKLLFHPWGEPRDFAELEFKPLT